ncbi:DDT domain-containing protein PTM-like isoform X1 [Solanum lycopersicum]|uniref:PHD-type domain-containing protein n=2 Tax=Solanum lycopersicum TaxID=4081 RepID=A0A3Q7GZZ8_SOLLC|nr:DDT domain-containing protein PTM-like [Solanum lycopersicum]
MRASVDRSVRRGRKRRQNYVQNDQVDPNGKKRAVVLRPKAFLGTYVRKKFKGCRKYMGKIISYDTGLYKIVYENGDLEDMDSSEVRVVSLEDDELNGQWLKRKKKLDEVVAKMEATSTKSCVENPAEPINGVIDKFEPKDRGIGCSDKLEVNHQGRDSDLVNDLSEYYMEQDLSSGVEVPLIPAPQLPPSSNSIGIPEEYVSCLLSVYSFLRSFSIRLFLYPFGLEDFVGALNCSAPNTLFDSVHVALMCALRRQLNKLSSDDSLLASKCLRGIDWGLLDTITWPVYLVHYLTVMGYIEQPGWKGFYPHTLQREYYLLSAGRKIMVLQILCDDVLESEEIRTEINMREESKLAIESDLLTDVACVSAPRIVHPRYAKTSACKGQEATELYKENHERKQGCSTDNLGPKVSNQDYVSGGVQNSNSDECCLCAMEGTLLCCDGCPSSYHARCIGVSKTHIPEGEWYCPECTINKIEPKITRGTTLKEAELFGVDSYGQIFMGTCSHLLVLKTLAGADSIFRYYNVKDIPRVLLALNANAQHSTLYQEICKGIMQYWKIPGNVFFPDGELSLIGSDRPNGTKFTCFSSLSLSSLIKGSAEQVGVEYIAPGGCFYMGSSFRPQQYINSYLHGDFAASAAANLAELSLGENQGSESHASDNRQKHSANALLQAKAFSSATTRFFWPSTEKKVVEVPRERCSWCLNCKAAVTSKKGCLLNAAASNAIKGAVKILAGLRSASVGEGNLRGIASYIILMEEGLCGLTVGPFLSTAFRKEWRKQAEEATSCTLIKSLLLQFEENIRSVAFSGDWFKLVDCGASESSVTHSTAGVVESSHKHKSGRRGRKPLPMVKVTADDCKNKPKDFTWWRGGILSKLLFQKAALPRSMLKKAARHGGLRNISGICDAEGSKTAKISRQLAWRAAVDVCKTISKLALQVRYLDVHVRWSDLVSPEQSLLDGKGPESEASSFRNASICHKRIVENEVRYSVAFVNQKHLPSRVKKSIIEVEQSQEKGKEKYWFSESRIPLYIIKDYEENLEKDLRSANKFADALPKLQRRCLVASCKDIFSYLAQKRDGNAKYCCASCEVVVSLRDVVKCNTCQGLCHKQCTFSSTIIGNEETEFLTCKQCYQNRALTQAESNHESPTSPLLTQGKDIPIPMSARKGGKVGSSSNPSASTATLKHSSKAKLASSNLATRWKHHWGIIWRKNNEDTGDFRSKHILLRGNPDCDSIRPSCRLCCKPYDPYLMYVRCETCTCWYHAEAVELEESKIFEVVGFKCCKCRRIKMPICPYLDPRSKRQAVERRMCARALKMDRQGIDSGFISELQKDENMATPALEDSKPLVSAVEELTEHFQVGDCERNVETISVQGQREQSVRSHIENETDLKSSELSTPHGGNIVFPKDEMPTHVEPGAKQLVRRHVRLEKDSDTPFASDPVNVLRNTSRESSEEYGHECKYMEFEPQTCFSFNDLLASDDLGLLDDGVDSSATINKDVEISSGFLPNKNADTSYVKHEPAVSTIPTASFTAPCKLCSRKEPSPDLCCETCEIWIHRHCSPWNDEDSGQDDWKCGNCREWR